MQRLILPFFVFLLCQQIAVAQKDPESYGFHSTELMQVVELAASLEIAVHSMHVSRYDSVFLDFYVAPFTDEMIHDVASVTKSILSLLIWKAISDSIITDIDMPAIELLPEKYAQNESTTLHQITVQNLLDMRSGWDCGLSSGEAELTAMRRSEEWIQEVLSMPFRSKPGTTFSYCSPNYHVLASILHYQTGDLLQYARKRLFEPLDINVFQWPLDPQGVPHGWGDLAMKPSDMIKIGHLLKNEGLWNAQKILPAELFAEINKNLGSESYRLGFWFSESEYEANGRGGQRITIIPSLDIVVVMTGGGFEPAILGGKLAEAFSGHRNIASDSTNYQQLVTRIDELNSIPSHRTTVDSFILFNGTTYSFSDNELNISAIKLTNNNSNLSLQMWLANGMTIEHPLRNDGLLSVKTTNHMGQAGRIVASTHNEVVLEFDTLSQINRYVLSLRVEYGQAALEVTDLTNRAVYLLKVEQNPSIH